MRRQWHLGLGRELGLAFWANFFLEATYGAYIGIWPLWIERLGAPIAVVGLVLGIGGIIRPFILGPSSSLAERIGTRRLIVGARLCALAGFLIAAAAQSWPLLLITVVTNALGELAFPFIHAHIADHAGAQPARAFALVITVGPSVAFILSPVIAGLLIAWFGIPAAFVLAAATTSAALLFFLRMRFTEAHERDNTGGRSTYAAAFRAPELRRIFVSHGVTILVIAVGTSLIPNFLSETRGMDAATISTLGAGAAIGSALFGLVVTRSRRLQRAPFVGVAIATVGISLGLAIFATQTAVVLIALAFILRGGLFSAWALFLGALGESAPAQLRSRAFTVLEILGGSALSFGPVIAAQLYRIEPVVPLIVSAVGGLVLVPFILHGHRQRGASAPRDAHATPVSAEPAASEQQGSGSS